jgi:hypothetical protein
VRTQSSVPLVIVTVEPLMVQPPLAAMLTASPELEVALTEKLVPYVAGLVGWANVIVWVAFAALTVRVTLGAGAYVPSPLWLATSVQPVVPLVIVTVEPLMVQPPLAATLTGSPEVDVGLTVKVAPYAAGLAGCVKVIVCGVLPTALTVTETVAVAPPIVPSFAVQVKLSLPL